MNLIQKNLMMPLLLVVIAGTVQAQGEPTADPGPLPVAEFQLTDFKGDVVLVDFWASWCVPCRDSLPWLNAMQQKYGEQGLQVVMVNLDKDPAAAAKMGAGIDAGIRQYLDPTGDLATRYDLEGMPSSYLYDRDGEFISSHIGFLKSDGTKREKAVLAILESEKK